VPEIGRVLKGAQFLHDDRSTVSEQTGVSAHFLADAAVPRPGNLRRALSDNRRPVHRQRIRMPVDIQRIEALTRELLAALGEDPDREGLQKTPERVARAMAFLTSGYRTDLTTLINGAIFTQTTNSMVIVKNIEVYSLCEHHMLPFFGRCHIGYIPTGRVFGVSKLARLVDMYARRLQLQERLTEQISQAVFDSIDARGVGVMIEARHLCMMMRGVEKQNSEMVTSSVLGTFRESETTRDEFLALIGPRGH
jgi:GTP cyclohydrolase IA